MEIKDSDTLARYAIDKAYFRQSGRVMHNAFMPWRVDKKCSVFNIEGISNTTIWQLGNKYVAKPNDKQLLARIEILVEQVKELSLEVVSDESIHRRHANICSYPTEKSEIKLKAMQLSSIANLVLNN